MLRSLQCQALTPDNQVISVEECAQTNGIVINVKALEFLKHKYGYAVEIARWSLGLEDTTLMMARYRLK